MPDANVPGGNSEVTPSEVALRQELQDRFIHQAVELPAVEQLPTLLVPPLRLLLTA